MATSHTALHGKVAVVTGGGSGLGAAMCREWAAAGMAVAVLDLDEGNAAAVAASLAEEMGVPATSARTDVGDTASVQAAAAHVRDTLGGCDVLCANVGVQQFGAVGRLSEAEWRWVMEVNVLGTVRTVDAFLPLLRAAAGHRQIVLTSSSSALLPGVRLGAYQASKFAVQGLGETLRLELADEGIGVTVMFPAGMTTRHLESSALAKPAEAGEWTIADDDIQALMASRDMGAEHVASAEFAVRNLVQDVLDDRPFIVTHGGYRSTYRARLADLDDAFDRMEATS